ncbi:MAG: DUF2946 family protein [Acidobacteriota bacterium]
MSSFRELSVRTEARRAGWLRLVALLAVVALGAGMLGLSHHHADDGHLDGHFEDDHCVVCHLQQPTIITTAVLDVAPPLASSDSARANESNYVGSVALQLSPPLRGPPIS